MREEKFWEDNYKEGCDTLYILLEISRNDKMWTANECRDTVTKFWYKFCNVKKMKESFRAQKVPSEKVGGNEETFEILFINKNVFDNLILNNYNGCVKTTHLSL